MTLLSQCLSPPYKWVLADLMLGVAASHAMDWQSFHSFICLFLQSLADTINMSVYLDKSSIITLVLDYTEYWKETRGASLGKLILCPLKFKYEQVYANYAL